MTKTSFLPRTSFVVLSVIATAVTACSAQSSTALVGASDGVGTVAAVAQADVINPGGNEIMAQLTVQLPTGSCLPGGTCSAPLAAAPQLTLSGGQTLTLGQPLRVAAGSYTLTVGPVGTQMPIVLAEREVRTLTLPVAQQHCTWTPPPTLPATDFGPLPVFHDAACPDTAQLGTQTVNIFGVSHLEMFYDDGACQAAQLLGSFPVSLAMNCSALTAPVTRPVWGIRFAGQCINIGDTSALNVCNYAASGNCQALGLTGDACNRLNSARTTSGEGYQPLAPGSYAFSVETAAGPVTSTRPLAEGQVATWNFELTAIGTVPATFTTNVHFTSTRTLPDAASTVIGATDCDRTYTVPVGSTPLALKAFRYDNCHYQVAVPGRTLPLVQTQTNEVSLSRMDVNDVTVTREDGTTYTTRGTWEVYFGGNKIAGPYPTSSGIDAVAGDYEVVVSYTTALGPQTSRYRLSFH